MTLFLFSSLCSYAGEFHYQTEGEELWEFAGLEGSFDLQSDAFVEIKNVVDSETGSYDSLAADKVLGSASLGYYGMTGRLVGMVNLVWALPVALVAAAGEKVFYSGKGTRQKFQKFASYQLLLCLKNMKEYQGEEDKDYNSELKDRIESSYKKFASHFATWQSWVQENDSDEQKIIKDGVEYWSNFVIDLRNLIHETEVIPLNIKLTSKS